MKRKEVKAIVETLSDAFYDLSQACKTLSATEQRRIFTPECLGEVSAFLAQGNGYEPFRGHFVPNVETIMDLFDDDGEDEDDGEFDEETEDSDE